MTPTPEPNAVDRPFPVARADGPPLPAEPTPSDRPFPGARAQVPRLRDDEPGAASGRAAAAQRSLPLESALAPREAGWSVRLPVRAEHVSIDKQVVVYERVTVRHREFEEHARVHGNVQREKLRVKVEGEPTMSPPPAVDRERSAP